jgi:hypothetical protein
VVDHPLVELALGALRRLAEAPPAAGMARAGLAELEQIAQRPLSIGIAGEPAARARLFETLCGESVLDLASRGGAVLRARRGPITKVRALRGDAVVDELARPPERTEAEQAAQTRAGAVRTELTHHEAAIARIDRSLPRIVRTRPARWAVWLWPVYWLVLWIVRRTVAERQLAERAVGDSRHQLEASEQDAAALAAETQRELQHYRDALRTLCAGGARAAGITELEWILASGPLPEGVEVVELRDASPTNALVDAVVVVDEGDETAMGRTLATLPAMAAEARTLAIARRAGDTLVAGRSALGAALDEVETGFRTRLARLEDQRLTELATFTAAQLARIGSEIASCVTAVMEHASVHLGAELAELQAAWIGAIASTTTADELKAAVAQIVEAWDAAARRVAEEIRVLVTGGLGGSVRDIYPTLVAPLRSLGLPEEHARPLRAAPTLPPLEILPSLDGSKGKLGAPGWLSGLVRSFESRRTSVREQLHERIEHLKEVSAAELLDAEPRLRATVGDALRAQLALALQHQARALDAAVAAEQVAIAREREAVAPVLRASQVARDDIERLQAGIARLEGDRPARP